MARAVTTSQVIFSIIPIIRAEADSLGKGFKWPVRRDTGLCPAHAPVFCDSAGKRT